MSASPQPRIAARAGGPPSSIRALPPFSIRALERAVIARVGA